MRVMVTMAVMPAMPVMPVMAVPTTRTTRHRRKGEDDDDAMDETRGHLRGECQPPASALTSRPPSAQQTSQLHI